MSLYHFNAAVACDETDQARVMARPATTDARVSPQDTLCVIYGGRSGNRTGFFSEYFAIPLLISCYPY